MEASIDIKRLDSDEGYRREQFPITVKKVFFGHAAITALPRCTVSAMNAYLERSATDFAGFEVELEEYKQARKACAELIGGKPQEIALLGPTTLGINLVANGIDWQPGDEIVCYDADYPANVYPWMEQERRGAKVVRLQPERPGEITPELVEAALTGKTRLVALASVHFFTGYAIDVEAIGRLLKERGVLFSLDAIQSVGALPTSVENVDFLSADAHKWMLGPMSAGIFYVKESRFEELRPTLLGAWNVSCPDFVVQDAIRFHPTAQRYEPGVLNVVGIHGMVAGIRMLRSVGIDFVKARCLRMKHLAVEMLESKGFEIFGPKEGPSATSITTFTHPSKDVSALWKALDDTGIVTSLRMDREKRAYIRISPHFYNTEAEVERLSELLQ
ncbi:MAG: aminotransferase class V-fold PLP-dependent enzyme [Verrucomicrobiota bacterium]